MFFAARFGREMDSVTREQGRVGLVGTDRTPRHFTMILGMELLALTVGFLLAVGILLPSAFVHLISVMLVIAPPVYAGWIRAGLGFGVLSAWAPILWNSFVPPIVGIVVGSNAPRYAHPRLIGIEYTTPRAELVH